ncbi:hypothetical protein Kpol_1002p8 [Vanderwaltozyma polyspora DSM 70294]|uniref:BRAP2 homolog n=1 Tax=Vanderwaltozyma polyspora (strain ATCC 22028 / DSM 70294 / BCRC 21397 / CBS 2163 / NBRC 10782 / NRRL Y-8283 / UCD 57-17) TaxID=436907 RepID=A7TE41_VANPO|nr:uncharacterized protein Kpol_1002p8 [Vanderwaltozyma polyspora DSM 70294]EDO19363.1 hypothetical protein Kpol_1002p8 [Vanderwaltozyma polyspora DSM 70294]
MEETQYTILVQLEKGEETVSSTQELSQTVIDQDWRFTDIWSSRQFSMQDYKGKRRIDERDLVVSEYLGHGIIRLFKDNDNSNDSNNNTERIDEDDLIVVPGDDTMVCMLFVPIYFTVHELLHFYIGDEIVYNQISNFRILKNSKKNDLGYNFMVLIKFRDPLIAKNFKEEFNGKKFNKLDSETCHVIPIKEVVFEKKLFLQQKNSDFPYLVSDTFTTIADDSKNPSQDQVELPTCPVCLERLDDGTTGLITIPCQHTFHCQCLDKWKNSKCPVCRYSNLKFSREALLRQNASSAHCSICDATDNLWMCLICGNVGCGRYNSKHAIQHYEDTSHCFAMDIRTQRVWDYAGDNYVHRLVQNEVDGKLIEIGTDIPNSNNPQESGSTSKDNNMATTFLRNKEYHLEYVQLLISQLESQREFYELKLQHSSESSNLDNVVEKLENELDALKLKIKDSESSYNQNTKALQKQLQEEKLINNGLQENLEVSDERLRNLQADIDGLNKEKQDLSEQVQDLMFFLESREKFKDADESVREGTIVVPASSNAPTKKAKNRKKKPGKK